MLIKIGNILKIEGGIICCGVSTDIKNTSKLFTDLCLKYPFLENKYFEHNDRHILGSITPVMVSKKLLIFLCFITDSKQSPEKTLLSTVKCMARITWYIRKYIPCGKMSTEIYINKIGTDISLLCWEEIYKELLDIEDIQGICFTALV